MMPHPDGFRRCSLLAQRPVWREGRGGMFRMPEVIGCADAARPWNATPASPPSRRCRESPLEQLPQPLTARFGCAPETLNVENALRSFLRMRRISSERPFSLRINASTASRTSHFILVNRTDLLRWRPRYTKTHFRAKKEAAPFQPRPKRKIALRQSAEDGVFARFARGTSPRLRDLIVRRRRVAACEPCDSPAPTYSGREP